MKKIAVTGLNGVIGKILIEKIPSNMELIDLYNTKKTISPRIKSHVKLNLLQKEKISKVLKKINPDTVLHMAAKTHIDNCERDKKNGKKGIVWKTNVNATKEIAKYCFENNVRIVFLSTECVFDGRKKSFSETDKKNPLNWYGYTKSNAEDEIVKSKARFSIIRAVVTYNKDDKGKTIYGKIFNNLKTKKAVYGVIDRQF